MIYADVQFLAEASVDVPENTPDVADESWEVARAAIADWVPAVVSDIMDE